MPRDDRDPQVELVRRYARILRSAPAEALRAQSAPAAERVTEMLQPPPRFGRRIAGEPTARRIPSR